MSFNESLLPNSNYPPMSQDEWDNAPFNEPMDDNFTRTVSISLSFDYTTTLPINADEERIKEQIEGEVRKIFNKFNKENELDDFGIDEVEVIQD